MRRLFTSDTGPAQGAVYRDLSASDKECLPLPTHVVITAPGCVSFPITDNEYASLPTRFALDVEVDAFAYDGDFSSLAPESGDPEFADLWGKLSAIHQTFIFIDGCYCIGAGIDRSELTIGRPQFPAVTPLPYFWMTRGNTILRRMESEGSTGTQRVVVDVTYDPDPDVRLLSYVWEDWYFYNGAFLGSIDTGVEPIETAELCPE